MEDLQSRLQFTIVVALFFPTFLGYVFTPEQQASLADVNLNWSVIVGLFILIYILLELMKIFRIDIAKRWISISLNSLLLLEIASFLPLLFFGMATTFKNHFLVIGYKSLALNSVHIMVFIPVIILLLILTNYLVSTNPYKK
ncbi:MAG: hypothetical protein WC059_02540 [Candidatus Paceibacterota bacterium]